MVAEQNSAMQDDVVGGVVILCAEEEVRDVIAYWSASLPVPAIVADDGYHANRLLKDTPCRLLVTDRVLPPWPGLDTLLTLRGRNPRLRVAFVDNGNATDRVLARLTGATDFLSRPLTRRAVIEVLDPPEPES
jgi:DNA-binding response OmpR family regulator